jgi:hypothetical protein
MKNGVFVIFMLLFLFSVSANIEITEIIPNPIGNDDEEWVELYNNGNEVINITGYVLKDNNDGHRLPITLDKTNSLNIKSYEYLVIHRNGDSDFSLNNRDGDQVRLFSENGTLLDQMEYFGSTEGRSWSKIDGEWVETDPTPGEENVVVTTCDYELSFELSDLIFTGDNAPFGLHVERVSGEVQKVTVKGEIRNLLGQTVKEYSPWKNEKVTTIKRKEYSPRLKNGVYMFEFWIDGLKCDETIENNRIKTLLAVDPQPFGTENSITIEKIYLGNDKKAAWGNQFTVKLNIYKGEETKNSGQVWVEKDGEKVSKISRLSMIEQFTRYPVTIPIQLDPNCDNKIDDGTAKLVVEAFGLHEEQEFLIKGLDKDVCKQFTRSLQKIKKELAKEQKEEIMVIVEGQKVSASGESSSESVTQQAITQTTRPQNPEEVPLRKINENSKFIVYQSSSEKAKELIPYILLLSFVLIVVILLKKK